MAHFGKIKGLVLEMDGVIAKHDDEQPVVWYLF